MRFAVVLTLVVLSGCPARKSPGDPDAGLCVAGEDLCGDGKCHDTLSDNAHCGACSTEGTSDRACAAGSVCSAGRCGVTCVAGQDLCGDNRCHDTLTDNGNCGSCSTAGTSDRACAAGNVCSAGTCGVTCVAGQDLCSDGRCHDTLTDNANCGSCSTLGTSDKACAAGYVCSAGKCGVTCVAGQSLCSDNKCHDPLTDNANCGACSTLGTQDKVCASGTVCSAGTCGVTCVAGQNLCPDNKCHDTLTDNANCGGCSTLGTSDKACAAGSVCSAGKCGVTCVAGQDLCSDNKCHDTLTDNANCGACSTSGTGDKVCATDNACAAGKCTAGHLDRVSRLYIRGWVCVPSGSGVAVPVYFFREGFVSIGQATADRNREEAVGALCGNDVAHGFMFRTPAALLDGLDHQVSAYFDPTHVHALPGSPLPTFNSHTLYEQEVIPSIDFNVGATYAQEVLDQHPELHYYYLDANANLPATVDNLFIDKTLMFVGMGTTALNPLPALDTPCLAAMTGLAVPSPSLYQRGIKSAGDCNASIHAVQAYDRSIGLSLAPKAVWGDVPALVGIFPLYNMTGDEVPSRAAQVFETSSANRVRLEGFFKHPYTNITPIGTHLITEEGLTFFYYTLQFRDVVHATERNRHIWFTVRLFQDKYVQPTEDLDQLTDTDTASFVDLGADPNTAIGGIDTILRPSSPRISPCGDSAFFSTATQPTEQKYCFEVSGRQFQNGVRDLNARKFRDQVGNLVVFSENPADYALVHINVNAEVWRPGTGAMDPRMALSFRDVRVTEIDSAEQPASRTTFSGLGPIATESLAGFPASNATDGDVATWWSSDSFPSQSNSRDVHFAGYLAGQSAINTVVVTAAKSSGVVEGFPAAYELFVTDSLNASWVPLGGFSVQPGLTGVATILLPGVYSTWGVMLRPTALGEDSAGTHYFRIAELWAERVRPESLTMGMLAGEELSGWPAANAGDANLSTAYSSEAFASTSNDRGVYLAGYHLGPSPVSTVLLTARLNGGSTPEAFPVAYDVWVTNADNTGWIFIANLTTQPDASGLVVVPLGGTFWTHGVRIQPTLVGTDELGGHYFQLAELALGVR